MNSSSRKVLTNSFSIPSPRIVRMSARRWLLLVVLWPGIYFLGLSFAWFDVFLTMQTASVFVIAAAAIPVWLIGVTALFLLSRKERARQRNILQTGLPVLGELSSHDEDLYLKYEVAGHAFEKLLPRTTKFFTPSKLENSVLIFVDEKNSEEFVIHRVGWYGIKGLKRARSKQA